MLALSRTCPPALVGINFLSGGMSEEEASRNLNAMNQLTSIRKPWHVSFSFGRALQNSCVKTWQGKQENYQAAQQALIQRCQANSQAQRGQYKGSDDAAANETLFVPNYRY